MRPFLDWQDTECSPRYKDDGPDRLCLAIDDHTIFDHKREVGEWTLKPPSGSAEASGSTNNEKYLGIC